MFLAKINGTEQLINLVNDQSNKYITIIGLVLAIFAFFQWRFSDKQLKNVKSEVKEELRKEYSLNDLNSRFTNIEKEVSNIEKNLVNDVIDNMTNLTVMIFNKLDLLIMVNNSLGKNSTMNDIINNLESLRLLKIKNSLKISNFYSIKKEMEKRTVDDQTDENDKKSINSLINIVNSMITELETKDKYNLENNGQQ